MKPSSSRIFCIVPVMPSALYDGLVCIRLRTTSSGYEAVCPSRPATAPKQNLNVGCGSLLPFTSTAGKKQNMIRTKYIHQKPLLSHTVMEAFECFIREKTTASIGNNAKDGRQKAPVEREWTFLTGGFNEHF